MAQYFFKMTNEEKNNILNQHKTIYDGYVTEYGQQTNKQPLYVQDYANDKVGLVVSNKGVVKPYTNMGINESHTGLDMIGDGPNDLENGTVNLDSSEYISLGRDMNLNKNKFDYDINGLFDDDDDETEDDDFGFESPFCKSCEGTGCEECDGSGMKRNQIGLEGDDVEFEGDGENSEIGTEEELNFDWLNSYQDDVDDEDLPNVVSSITESLDMFKRFKKYN